MSKSHDINKYFEYLNGLMESGITNMFGATPYLETQFGLNQEEARAILLDWMTSFGKGESK